VIKPVQLTLTIVPGQEDQCARAVYAAVPANLRKTLAAFCASVVQQYEAANRAQQILVVDVPRERLAEVLREVKRS
jgi:hypothetical protein